MHTISGCCTVADDVTTYDCHKIVASIHELSVCSCGIVTVPRDGTQRILVQSHAKTVQGLPTLYCNSFPRAAQYPITTPQTAPPCMHNMPKVSMETRTATMYYIYL